MNVLDLTKALINIPSISPEDSGCMDLIIPRLQKLGFSIEKFPCEKTSNLWARYGDKAPLLCFLGHTDVVPPGPEDKWQSPPFTATESLGYLYGRGAADMKSGVAAMLVAVEKYFATQPSFQGSIAFLLTSAEEEFSSTGVPIVIQALTERKEKIDYCIVGEPSSLEEIGDTIKNGRRGSLNGKLTIYGKQGHIAYPQFADNPIHHALTLLKPWLETKWDKGNKYFSATSLQISNIHAGTGTTNVIPEDLVIDFNFRFSPKVSAKELQEKTEAILRKRGLTFSIDWQLSGNPFYCENKSFIKMCQDAIKYVTGKTAKLSTAGGTSDGRFLAPTGTQVIEIGLLNKTIHQINECIKIKDLEQLVEIYYECLLRFEKISLKK